MATVHQNLSVYDKSTIPDAQGMRIGIVVSKWNTEITENLFKGCYHTLIDCGVSSKDIKRIDVPGSFELVYAANQLLKSDNTLDSLVVIGTVIQGETKHFDFVCQGVTQGITQLNLTQDKPVIFCVLTDNTIEQSRARSGGEHGNKGTEAAITAIEMVALKNNLC